MRAPRQDPPVLLPESSPPATGTGEPLLALAEPPGRVSLWTGGLLILLSFCIYPAYPLVPFLPISLWQKGGVGVALVTISWAMFLAGCALVGKKGVAYLKRRLFSQRAPA